ncbi:MAG TPA: mycofactocin precursor MftA [Streptosporangiaceae bacterium]
MAESTALAERQEEAAELPAGHPVTGAEPAAAATAVPPPVLAEELLVEEVSIDGMCGVY